MTKQKKKARRRGGGGGASSSSTTRSTTTTRGRQTAPNADAPPPSEEAILARLRAGTLTISRAQMVGMLRIFASNEPNTTMDAALIGSRVASTPYLERALTHMLLGHTGTPEEHAATLAMLERFGRPDADVGEIRAVAARSGYSAMFAAAGVMHGFRRA